MFTEEMVKKIIEMAVFMNNTLYPWSLIVPVVLATIMIILVINNYKNPGLKISRILKFYIGLVYQYAGLSTLLMAKENLTFALEGTIALCSIGILFFIDMGFKNNIIRLSKNKDLRTISIILMGTGIFLYPLIEILTGFNWPGMVLFGAECPTTIFVIGLLIGALPNVNRLIYLLLAVNATFVGISVGIAGGYFDYSYGAAGVLALIMAVKYRKEFLFKKKIHQ